MGSRKPVPEPILSRKYRLTHYNTPEIALTYCVTKSFGGGLGSHGFTTGQPGLVIDREGAGSIDKVVPYLKGMVISRYACTIFSTQGVVIVEFNDNLHHRVEIGICHTIGDTQTTEDSVGVSRVVDVEIAYGSTIRHFWFSEFVAFGKGEN